MTIFAVLGRVVIFFLSFAAGTLVAWLLAGAFAEEPQVSLSTSIYSDIGSGTASCRGKMPTGPGLGSADEDRSKLRITSKPGPGYTDEARLNNVEGTVVLRVQFLASGQIGSIQPVRELPDGLTEQAIAAARRIRFEPKEQDGKPVTITKQIEYTFTIY